MDRKQSFPFRVNILEFTELLDLLRKRWLLILVLTSIIGIAGLIMGMTRTSYYDKNYFYLPSIAKQEVAAVLLNTCARDLSQELIQNPDKAGIESGIPIPNFHVSNEGEGLLRLYLKCVNKEQIIKFNKALLKKVSSHPTASKALINAQVNSMRIVGDIDSAIFHLKQAIITCKKKDLVDLEDQITKLSSRRNYHSAKLWDMTYLEALSVKGWNDEFEYHEASILSYGATALILGLLFAIGIAVNIENRKDDKKAG